ncbi:HigA family addiction module antitoxin [Curvivirga sp.]|uniref:HigA family addiction module antitoxin n=1 Tax=Curvivirga sp. TaxID=2856848 RepID=UPI003B5B2ADD
MMIHNPPHPVEVIEDAYLPGDKWKQENLVNVTGVAPEVISQFMQKKHKVTHELAMAFEKAFGLSADGWMKLQADYDLWQQNAANYES